MSIFQTKHKKSIKVGILIMVMIIIPLIFFLGISKNFFPNLELTQCFLITTVFEIFIFLGWIIQKITIKDNINGKILIILLMVFFYFTLLSSILLYFYKISSYFFYSSFVILIILIVLLLIFYLNYKKIEAYIKEFLGKWELFIKNDFWGKNWVKFVIGIFTIITIILSIYAIQIEQFGRFDSFIVKEHFELLHSNMKKEIRLEDLDKDKKEREKVYIFCVDISGSTNNYIDTFQKINNSMYLDIHQYNQKTKSDIYFYNYFFSESVLEFNKKTKPLEKKIQQGDSTEFEKNTKRLADMYKAYKNTGKKTIFTVLFNKLNFIKGTFTEGQEIVITIFSDFKQTDENDKIIPLDKELKEFIEKISVEKKIIFNLISPKEEKTDIINYFEKQNNWYNVRFFCLGNQKNKSLNHLLNFPSTTDEEIKFLYLGDNINSYYTFNTDNTNKQYSLTLSFVNNYLKYSQDLGDKYYKDFYPNMHLQYQVMTPINKPKTGKINFDTLDINGNEKKIILTNEEKLQLNYKGKLLTDKPSKPFLCVSIDENKKEYIIPISFIKTIPNSSLWLLFILEILLLLGVLLVLLLFDDYLDTEEASYNGQQKPASVTPNGTYINIVTLSDFKEYNEKNSEWLKSKDIAKYNEAKGEINKIKTNNQTSLENIQTIFFRDSLSILFEKGYWEEISNKFSDTNSMVVKNLATKSQEWKDFLNSEIIDIIQISGTGIQKVIFSPNILNKFPFNSKDDLELKIEPENVQKVQEILNNFKKNPNFKKSVNVKFQNTTTIHLNIKQNIITS